MRKKELIDDRFIALVVVTVGKVEESMILDMEDIGIALVFPGLQNTYGPTYWLLYCKCFTFSPSTFLQNLRERKDFSLVSSFPNS